MKHDHRLSRARIIARLSFVHLSDIHFAHDTRAWDLDSEIRNEIELDLERWRPQLEPLSGFLVTGDVAYSGAEHEYKRAEAWLTRLCDMVGVPAENVWVVPGNHDVDRSVGARSKTLQHLHRRLRSCSVAELDEALRDVCTRDEISAGAILKPLENYLNFATGYGCAVTTEQPYWQDAFTLGQLTIELRGLTSVMVSNGEDSDNEDVTKLVLGSMQAMLLRRRDVIYVTMCHHPPPWLRDGDVVAASLRPSARVQLWGHRHVHDLDFVEGNLYLGAGAVHPHRREDKWEPRYNILQFEADDVDPKQLLIRVFPRRWTDDRCFDEDLFAPSTTCELDVFAAREAPEGADDATTGPTPVNTPEERYAAPPDVVVANRKRRLGREFSQLPFQERLEVAREAGLVAPEEFFESEPELFRAVFRRAGERSLLALLWERTMARRSGSIDVENPFEG